MSNSNSDVSNGSGKKKVNSTVVVAVVAVVIIGALIAAIFYILGQKPETEEVTDGRGTLVTPENVEELIQEVNDPTPVGSFMTDMTNDWTFQTSTTPSSDVHIGNDISNLSEMYFEIVLENGDGTEDVLYSSPYVPIGSAVENIALDKELAPGDYSAVVRYHQVDDSEPRKEIGKVSVAVNIHILG